MNDGTASVGSIRAQLKRWHSEWGSDPSVYNDIQKNFVLTLQDRLASRVHHRRERIALAILAREGQMSQLLMNEIRSVESALDQLELQDGST